MSAPAAPPPPWAGGLVRRMTRSRGVAIGAVLALTALVGALDYATGYEMRLATLYLVPIALATWVGGWRPGMLTVVLASLFWLLSFAPTHPYSRVFFFYWEGIVMVAVYCAFVLLLMRLRGALTRADERFSRVLEELYSGVYVADQQSGEVLYANPSLERLSGADPCTLDERTLNERLGFGQALLARGQDGKARAPVAAVSGFVSQEVRHPASGRWYLVRVGPIPWTSGRHVKLHMITDITEQKRANSLKQQHQEMLHKTARLASLAEIASSLAHEINQPLMAIASYNEACLRLLEAQTVNKSELLTALRRCREQAVRAGRIISHVREFIRSKRPSPGLCDINALIGEALELLETQLEDKGVTMRLALSQQALTMHADQTLLVQVILNLLQNAIDAMEACPPERRTLSIESGRSGDGAIVVSVSDQGDGLPDVVGDQLFTPFMTTKAQGLGLGLSICRSVVEAHGGHIGYRANADGGSTFHFALPAQAD